MIKKREGIAAATTNAVDAAAAAAEVNTGPNLMLSNRRVSWQADAAAAAAAATACSSNCKSTNWGTRVPPNSANWKRLNRPQKGIGAVPKCKLARHMSTQWPQRLIVFPG